MRYTLDSDGGHMFVPLSEGSFLVDTGSPTSFSRTGTLSFRGQAETVARNALGMLDADKLSGYVGVNVDGLIGMDLLSRHLIVFNGNEMLVDECPVPDSDFSDAGDESFMGIPVISFQIDGRTVKMFVDTGAKVSYLDAALMESFLVEETVRDFYPGFGQFNVDVSTASGEIAGYLFTARFGRLPALLQMTLMMGACRGSLAAICSNNSVSGWQEGELPPPSLGGRGSDDFVRNMPNGRRMPRSTIPATASGRQNGENHRKETT